MPAALAAPNNPLFPAATAPSQPRAAPAHRAPPHETHGSATSGKGPPPAKPIGERHPGSASPGSPVTREDLDLHGLSPATHDRPHDRQPLPLLVLAVACCSVGVWSIYSNDLFGKEWQHFPLLLAAGMLAFISLFELRVGFAVLLIAIGLSPEYTIMGIPNFRYEDVVIPILLLVWLSKHVMTRARLQPTDLKLPLLVIVFVSLFSSLNNHLYSGLDLAGALLRFGKSIEYYVIFLLVLNTLHTKADIRGFYVLMLLASALVGLFGLMQWSTHGGGDGFRLPGPRGETANILGGYYVFHICLALGLMVRIKASARPLLLLYLAIMLVPVGLTLSRTSYVALIIGVVTIWGVSRSSSIGWPLSFMLLFTLFVPEAVSDRFETIFGVFSGDVPSSWQARVAGWGLYVPAALERPLFGHGVGSRSLGAVDSEYVLQLYSLGIVGLGAFLWLITRCLKTSYRLQKQAEGDPWIQGFALGYFGGAVSLLAHSIAATTFTTIRTTEPFFFATGILYVCWNRTQRRHRDKDDARPPLDYAPLGLRSPEVPSVNPLLHPRSNPLQSPSQSAREVPLRSPLDRPSDDTPQSPFRNH